LGRVILFFKEQSLKKKTKKLSLFPENVVGGVFFASFFFLAGSWVTYETQ